MLYTHAWGIFFGAGAAFALIPIYRASDDRKALLRDAVMAFVGAGILFLPWLPNFIYQVDAHRRAVGAAAAVRRARAALARPARRRPDHDRAGARDGHRRGRAVHPAVPAHDGRDEAVGADRAAVRDAGAGVARVTDHAGVRVAVLRAGAGVDLPARGLGLRPVRDRRPRGDGSLGRVRGAHRVIRAPVQERHA